MLPLTRCRPAHAEETKLCLWSSCSGFIHYAAQDPANRQVADISARSHYAGATRHSAWGLSEKSEKSLTEKEYDEVPHLVVMEPTMEDPQSEQRALESSFALARGDWGEQKDLLFCLKREVLLYEERVEHINQTIQVHELDEERSTFRMSLHDGCLGCHICQQWYKSKLTAIEFLVLSKEELAQWCAWTCLRMDADSNPGRGSNV